MNPKKIYKRPTTSLKHLFIYRNITTQLNWKKGIWDPQNFYSQNAGWENYSVSNASFYEKEKMVLRAKPITQKAGWARKPIFTQSSLEINKALLLLDYSLTRYSEQEAPSQVTLDFWTTKTKTIKVCCYKWLSFGVINYW